MLRPDNPDTEVHQLRFGGGLNTRRIETDINPLECAAGQNFHLDLASNLFGRRRPFDLVDTATNGESILGFAQLKKTDNTLTTLVQAGSTVYQWDANGTFTSVGTVPSGSKLRGPLSQNWLLDDLVIITDLNKVSPVLEWNGTALTELVHGLGGDFLAKYAAVDNERAIYCNVTSGSATPHLIVSSKLSDHNNLSVSDRPSSGIGVDAAWFLPVPDLRPINGVIAAFNVLVFSTEGGRIYKLTGTNSQDFAVAPFYPNSGAKGDEAIAYVGNDIIYGRDGKIESLGATERFGDVETDDLSREINGDLTDINDWNIVYNARFQKVYCFSANNSTVYVYHKSIRDEVFRLQRQEQQAQAPISPWSQWETDHAIAFQPTCVQTILRPTDGREVTYIGGTDGAIYQLEGDGGQDGGVNDLEVKRTSGVFRAKLAGPSFQVVGWITYRRRTAATVTLTFKFGGSSQFDQVITVSLAAADNTVFYGGSFYYGGEIYYGTKFEGRLALQNFNAAGRSEQFQVEVKIDGAVDVEINEIIFWFDTK